MRYSKILVIASVINSIMALLIRQNNGEFVIVASILIVGYCLLRHFEQLK